MHSSRLEECASPADLKVSSMAGPTVFMVQALFLMKA